MKIIRNTLYTPNKNSLLRTKINEAAAIHKHNICYNMGEAANKYCESYAIAEHIYSVNLAGNNEKIGSHISNWARLIFSNS